MSFQAFLQDPKAYLNIHQMSLSGSAVNLVPVGMTQAAPVANAAHGLSVQFTHIANVEMTLLGAAGAKNVGAFALGAAGLMNKRSVTYSAQAGGAFPNLRILPWRGTDVTFMQLNGAADFVLTGPITGCTISVVRHGGAVWIFHANVAGGGGVGAANRATKRNMIQNAGAIVGIPAVANYQYCEYGPGFTYNGQGFVWGRMRGGGNWKFYVHEVQPADPNALVNKFRAVANQVRPTIDTKWADI